MSCRVFNGRRCVLQFFYFIFTKSITQVITLYIHQLITVGFLLIKFHRVPTFAILRPKEEGKCGSLRKKPEKPRVFYHQTIVEKNMNKYPYRTRKKKKGMNKRTNEKEKEKRTLAQCPIGMGSTCAYPYEKHDGIERAGLNVICNRIYNVYTRRPPLNLLKSLMLQPRRRLVPFSFRPSAACVYI
jgi:hypothetical protein